MILPILRTEDTARVVFALRTDETSASRKRYCIWLGPPPANCVLNFGPMECSGGLEPLPTYELGETILTDAGDFRVDAVDNGLGVKKLTEDERVSRPRHELHKLREIMRDIECDLTHSSLPIRMEALKTLVTVIADGTEMLAAFERRKGKPRKV